MTTTNNLIGYDPLAWLEGEEIAEEAVTPAPEETTPAKKTTKSRAKTKKVESVEEPAVVEIAETTPESVEGEIVAEDDSDEIEVDVSVNEDGEISISIEASEDDEVRVEVSVEDNVEEETAENDVMEAIAEEVANEEIAPEVETSVEEETPTEEVAPEETANADVVQEETVVEEAPIEAAVEPHIDLEKDATIKNVAALYSTIKNALAAHDVIEINAADVASVDTATLQLLVSLKKDAPNLGKTVEIIYPSERFLESAKLLGLTEILGV